MFEEVNYMTSAIPAEVLAGGVSNINMVTKAGGNKWNGSRSNFANDGLQGENWATPHRRSARPSSATPRKRPTT